MFDMIWQTEIIERPRGWQPDWPLRRRRPTAVLAHHVYRTALGYRVVQHLEAPGCCGPLVQSVFLPDFADYVECEAQWEMGLEVHPEATYLLFPFNVPQATARLDLGGQTMTPGIDQLAGTCRDYYTVQQWVDFGNREVGIMVALPENPMVQLGDFHFGHDQAQFSLERAMLLGWVTNNYWETNFRARQPGRVHARYRLLPYQGDFDEGRAHRFGLEAAQAQPLLQHLGEQPFAGPLLPQSGSLLRLPGHDTPHSSILTLHVKPAEGQSGIIIRLLNASDEVQEAEIGSGLLPIVAARQCDLLERPLSALVVENGSVRLSLPPRRITTLLLNCGG
jgi:hypothetical protein